MKVLCIMRRIASAGWLALAVACDKTTAPRDQEPKTPAPKTRVTITPVPDPVATRSIAIAGVIRGDIDTKLGAPYAFDVLLDGVSEKYSSAPYGYREDSPAILVPKPDGTLEFYVTMRGLVANGTHTIEVRVADAASLADSAVTQVVTNVPDVAYTAESLPLPPELVDERQGGRGHRASNVIHGSRSATTLTAMFTAGLTARLPTPHQTSRSRQELPSGPGIIAGLAISPRSAR